MSAANTTPGWVLMPLELTDDEAMYAQGALLDMQWDATTCFVARYAALVRATEPRRQALAATAALPTQALAALLAERLETWGDPVARAQLGQDIARIFAPAAPSFSGYIETVKPSTGLDWSNAAPAAQQEEPVEWQARCIWPNGQRGEWVHVGPTKVEPTQRQRAEYLASLRHADGSASYEVRALIVAPTTPPQAVQPAALPAGEPSTDQLRDILRSRGLAAVPMVMTRSMSDVVGEEDWAWPDLLAAAESVNEADYNALIEDQPLPAGEPSDEQIREVFLSNGFTIKEGHTDLKPYVYAAARAVLALRNGGAA